MRKLGMTEGEKLFREQLYMETSRNGSFHFRSSFLSPLSRPSLSVTTDGSSPTIISATLGYEISIFLFISSFSSILYLILASIRSVEEEIFERKSSFSGRNCRSCRRCFRSISPRRPTRLSSPPQHEPNASGHTSTRCRTMVDRRKEIKATTNFQGKFVEFHFDSDFMTCMKVDP